jgi:nitroreductase
MNHDIFDIIHARRSTRSFENRQIEKADLEKLLDAAIWAPSGGNNQSWLFTAIHNAAIIDKLNGVIREAFKTYEPDDDYPGKHGAKKAAQNESFHFCNHAPTLIIASNKPNYENAMADCSLALENIFLAAEALGLGSCYINSPHWLRNDSGLRNFLAELGVPKEHTICNSAAIGYIATPSTPPVRKPDTWKIIE